MPRIGDRKTLALCLLMWSLDSQVGLAITTHKKLAKAHHEIKDDLFPRPPTVRKLVRFWRKIFYEYSSTTAVIHDANDTDRIVDVIDYSPLEKQRYSFMVPRRDRDEVTSRNLIRYIKAAENFAKEGESAVNRGEPERRLYDAYKSNPMALQRLYKGEVKLRAQGGLADDLIQAAANAQVYLPQMEKIFLRYGVPTILTRLPFVESMFNLKARSKVGASGIWQFMPQTARHYIFVNDLVDERNAPEKATKAAAQFLANNYRMLGSWPLAITAYNHGVIGMANAVKKHGTKDIGTIIDSYYSPSFGFASRNFYSEFLAAADTYEKLYRQNRIPKPLDYTPTASVIIRHPMSVAQILQSTSITKEQLTALNPCLLEPAWTKKLNKQLPSFYEIKVPKNLHKAIQIGIKNFDAKRYARR
ncbi:MAG: lytic transglycosylase domain-containing protein [Deltaproteobacteria bacterium]|nr:lytic transglycosylase domain-containing protein [Deltaproteobacteria bacterium]